MPSESLQIHSIETPVTAHKPEQEPVSPLSLLIQNLDQANLNKLAGAKENIEYRKIELATTSKDLGAQVTQLAMHCWPDRDFYRPDSYQMPADIIADWSDEKLSDIRDALIAILYDNSYNIRDGRKMLLTLGMFWDNGVLAKILPAIRQGFAFGANFVRVISSQSMNNEEVLAEVPDISLSDSPTLNRTAQHILGQTFSPNLGSLALVTEIERLHSEMIAETIALSSEDKIDLLLSLSQFYRLPQHLLEVAKKIHAGKHQGYGTNGDYLHNLENHYAARALLTNPVNNAIDFELLEKAMDKGFSLGQSQGIIHPEDADIIKDSRKRTLWKLKITNPYIQGFVKEYEQEFINGNFLDPEGRVTMAFPRAFGMRHELILNNADNLIKHNLVPVALANIMQLLGKLYRLPDNTSVEDLFSEENVQAANRFAAWLEQRGRTIAGATGADCLQFSHINPGLSRELSIVIIRHVGLAYSLDSDDYTSRDDSQNQSRRRSRKRGVVKSSFEVELEKQGLDRKIHGSIIETRQKVLNELISSEPDWGSDYGHEEFELYNREFNRGRNIPSFQELLKRRIDNFFQRRVLESIDHIAEELPKIAEECNRLIQEAYRLYLMVSKNIVPGLRHMNTALQKDLFGKGIWFSGRDGIFLLLSLKSQFWGQKLGVREQFGNVIFNQVRDNAAKKAALINLARKQRQTRGLNEGTEQELLDEGTAIFMRQQARLFDLLKFAGVSRLVVDNLKSDEDRQNLRLYFEKAGITPDMLAVDTGYSGTVIRSVQEVLFGYQSLGKITLLESHNPGIKKIFGASEDSEELDHSEIASRIENLPKKDDRSIAVTPDGRLIQFPNEPDVQLLNWVAEHAIMRHIAPRAKTAQTLQNIRHDVAASERWPTQPVSEIEVERLDNLYKAVEKNIAPAVISYADSLLRKLLAAGSKTKLVFYESESYLLYRATQALAIQFPERYKETADQIVYAPVSAELLAKTSAQDLDGYLKYRGLRETDHSIILAGIGPYATAAHDFSEAIARPTDKIHFFISETNDTEGHVHSPKKPLPAFLKEPAAPGKVLSRLAPLFSDVVKSPRAVNNTTMTYQGDTTFNDERFHDLLSREYALRGVLDTITNLDSPPDINLTEAQVLLNSVIDNDISLERLSVQDDRVVMSNQPLKVSISEQLKKAA